MLMWCSSLIAEIDGQFGREFVGHVRVYWNGIFPIKIPIIWN